MFKFKAIFYSKSKIKVVKLYEDFKFLLDNLEYNFVYKNLSLKKDDLELDKIEYDKDNNVWKVNFSGKTRKKIDKKIEMIASDYKLKFFYHLLKVDDVVF